MISSFTAAAQNNNMDEKISELFFNLNLNQKPEEIAKSSYLEFDYNFYTIITEIHTYTAEFKEYPKLNHKIKKGEFTIEYDASSVKNGVFRSSLHIIFENETDMIDAYEKLKNQFKEYGVNEINENHASEYGLDIKHIEYYKYKNYEIPRLTFASSIMHLTEPALSIEFVNSWKFDKLKKQ